MPPLISVIICTYNRADLLAEALGTLAQQMLDPGQFEIIVVDNNSVDRTREMVAELSACLSNLRYCVETEVGLSHARNRGLREAAGAYVAYTDDDCKLPSEWLDVACRIIEEQAAEVFGGPYYAFYTSDKPAWFKDEYASRGLDQVARILREDEFLIGNNLFGRRDLFEQVGGFPANLGMSGTTQAYGEEVALQRRIRQQMPHVRIFYDPALFVYHLVRPEKMKWRWLLPAFVAKGRDVYRASHADQDLPRSRPQIIGDICRTTLAMAMDISWGAWRRDRVRYVHTQNYVFEHSSQYLRRLGRLTAQLYDGRRS